MSAADGRVFGESAAAAVTDPGNLGNSTPPESPGLVTLGVKSGRVSVEELRERNERTHATSRQRGVEAHHDGPVEVISYSAATLTINVN